MNRAEREWKTLRSPLVVVKLAGFGQSAQSLPSTPEQIQAREQKIRDFIRRMQQGQQQFPGKPGYANLISEAEEELRKLEQKKQEWQGLSGGPSLQRQLVRPDLPPGVRIDQGQWVYDQEGKRYPAAQFRGQWYYSSPSGRMVRIPDAPARQGLMKKDGEWVYVNAQGNEFPAGQFQGNWYYETPSGKLMPATSACQRWLRKVASMYRQAGDLEFDYSSLADDMWRELVLEAQDLFNVHFDLENNDPIGKASFRTKAKECKFECQACVAHGDWEASVLYFRCQLLDHPVGMNVESFGEDLRPYGNSFFIFIPRGKEANPHLVPHEKSKGGLIAIDSDKDEGISDGNIRAGKKELQDFLESICKGTKVD